MHRHSIILRAHHIPCLLTFVGKGYSSAFNRNMRAVAQRLSNGEPARIIEGYDSVCHNPRNGFMCPKVRDNNCDPQSKEHMDRLALADLRAHIPPAEGWMVGNLVLFRPTLVHRMRNAFATGLLRSACAQCPWQTFCSDVAADSFKKTLFFPDSSNAKPRYSDGLYIPLSDPQSNHL